MKTKKDYGYDFSRLTARQKELLSCAGWYPGAVIPQPGKSTVQKLLDRGLIGERTVTSHGLLVTVYVVPIAVHRAWCAYCADHYKEDDEQADQTED